MTEQSNKRSGPQSLLYRSLPLLPGGALVAAFLLSDAPTLFENDALKSTDNLDGLITLSESDPAFAMHFGDARTDLFVCRDGKTYVINTTSPLITEYPIAEAEIWNNQILVPSVEKDNIKSYFLARKTPHDLRAINLLDTDSLSTDDLLRLKHIAFNAYKDYQADGGYVSMKILIAIEQVIGDRTSNANPFNLDQ